MACARFIVINKITLITPGEMFKSSAEETNGSNDSGNGKSSENPLSFTVGKKRKFMSTEPKCDFIAI